MGGTSHRFSLPLSSLLFFHGVHQKRLVQERRREPRPVSEHSHSPFSRPVASCFGTQATQATQAKTEPWPWVVGLVSIETSHKSLPCLGMYVLPWR